MAQGDSFCRNWITGLVNSLNQKKRTFRFHRSMAAMCPKRASILLLQIVNTRDYLDGATAFFADHNIDMESSIEAV
jgi:hypothetical protein